MHPKLGLTTVLLADACMHDGPNHHWPHLDIALATLQYQCCPGSIFDLCHRWGTNTLIVYSLGHTYKWHIIIC